MEYTFGKKLRNIRERKKMTMKEISTKAGVSESMISQIENNKVSPAIDTLIRICQVLDLDLPYLFADYKPSKPVNIIRKEERSVLIQSNSTYEKLVKTIENDGSHGIEAYFMTIPVGGKSGSSGYGHIGKELGVIMEGQGQFTLGNTLYDLQTGDSISFDSDLPHELVNTGKVDLKAFWVISPPKRFDIN